MSQETSSKYNKLKKRVKSALGKSANSSRAKLETLDFKKKGFQGNDGRGQSRRVKTDRIESSVDDEFFKRRGDSLHVRSYGARSKRIEGGDGSYDDNKLHKKEYRERGFKSNYKDRRVGEVRDTGIRSKRMEGSDGVYDDSKLHKKEYRERGFKSNNKDRRLGGIRDNKEDAFEARGFKRVNSDSKRKRIYADNGRNSSEKESLDERGDRNRRDKVKMAENGDNRNGFLKNGGDVKHDFGKKLPQKQNDLPDGHEFGKKKFQNRKSLADDSEATFDRPRRKRRVIRIEYPNDVTNKRFDDSTPTVNNTAEQKDDQDTDKSDEMSQNAQFRAIQPSPSIISFVQENLLGRRREIEFKKAGYNIDLSAPLDNTPFSTSSEKERIEEPVFRNKLTFFAAAKISSSFPSPDLPEIAFAGRSNVGKSSLLNSLTRQWGVVRTSDKPGLTQTINFFNLGSKLCLVDLPGYGFAYAKEEVKESWEELVKEYVSTRNGLKRVCLLIDTKWGMKPRDHELVDLMERSKTKYQIVLTKTDLAFPVDVARRAMQIEESLKTKKSAVQPLMMVSSKTGAGIRCLRTVLSNISRFARL